jgi:hypothetical protein
MSISMYIAVISVVLHLIWVNYVYVYVYSCY